MNISAHASMSSQRAASDSRFRRRDSSRFEVASTAPRDCAMAMADHGVDLWADGDLGDALRAHRIRLGLCIEPTFEMRRGQELISAREAARRSGVCEDAVQRGAREGRIAVVLDFSKRKVVWPLVTPDGEPYRFKARS